LAAIAGCVLFAGVPYYFNYFATPVPAALPSLLLLSMLLSLLLSFVPLLALVFAGPSPKIFGCIVPSLLL
jgi:hypothetical protein